VAGKNAVGSQNWCYARIKAAANFDTNAGPAKSADVNRQIVGLLLHQPLVRESTETARFDRATAPICSAYRSAASEACCATLIAIGGLEPSFLRNRYWPTPSFNISRQQQRKTSGHYNWCDRIANSAAFPPPKIGPSSTPGPFPDTAEFGEGSCSLNDSDLRSNAAWKRTTNIWAYQFWYERLSIMGNWELVMN